MHRRVEILIIFLVVASFGVLYAFAMNNSPPEKKSTDIATFAGGCFWCMQQAMDEVDGVVFTKVGYTGGQKADPSYEEVSAGGTGHAEAVEVHFDPEIVSYQKLLEAFWHNIDPTVKDQQFCDKGSQYRSAIYYHTPAQEQAVKDSKHELINSARFDHIYTEIAKASTFYDAEKYHQNYYKKNPVRYKLYKYLCGREQRLEEVWGKPPENK